MALNNDDMNRPMQETFESLPGNHLVNDLMHDDDITTVSHGRYPCITFLLSLFCPGLGHMYIGQLRKGIILVTIGALYIHLLSLGLMGKTFNSMATYLILAITYMLYIIADSVITAFRRQEYTLKPYNRRLFYAIFVIVSICLSVVNTSVAKKYGELEAFKIPSGSMMPTLLPGDHLITDRQYTRNAKPQRGDVIVFRYPPDPRKNFIKRVIAAEGDTVEIVDKRVRLNGALIDEPYALHTDHAVLGLAEGRRDNIPPLTVPEGKYFVLGDNRDDSHDSRYWGFVDSKDIKAKALYIYWSWDSVTSTPRFSRIDTQIK